MKKIAIVFLVIVLVCALLIFAFLFFYDEDWLTVDTQVVENCKLVKIGTSLDEVIVVMGAPYYDRMTAGKRHLTYFMGGLQTEAGITFEFENNVLVRKFCGREWE